MARIAIVGCGATGARAARQLARGSDDHELHLVDDAAGVAGPLATSLGPRARERRSTEGADIVVLATRTADHPDLAVEAVARGQHVVSVADGLPQVRRLLALHESAKRRGVTVAVGAGMMPGLSDLLVAHAADRFDRVDEIHVAKFGTGGPDCARQHHRALKSACIDWRDGAWVTRAGGSGRELAWFPQPVQAADCYRAALPDPLLLSRSHPTTSRITARMAATRRDRATMHLPMLRRPHPEGLLGAIRVELRGEINGARSELVLGCAERPAVAAGTVAAAAASALAAQSTPVGCGSLAELFDPLAMLHDCRRRGLTLEIFVGADESTA